MANVIANEKKLITFESPEFKSLLSEVMNQSEAIQKRESLSEESFRIWLCDVISFFADKLGYFLENLKDIPMDMAYSFSKGFQAGRERAKKNSYRYKRR